MRRHCMQRHFNLIERLIAVAIGPPQLRVVDRHVNDRLTAGRDRRTVLHELASRAQ